jgi:mRNA-degrading endonuclease toxin of MazEF toxin-antitoxin module
MARFSAFQPGASRLRARRRSLDQIRTLDKQRLVKRLGAVSAPTFAQTLTTLRKLFEP